MDINITNNLSFLKKITGLLIFVVLLFSSPAAARVTVEAVTANGVRLYSGDSLSSSPTINVTIVSNTNLTMEADAMVLRINNTGTNLTPSSRNAGTITASSQPVFTSGTHRLSLVVKESDGSITSWEATNLIVDSDNELKTLSEPLNFPNPCNVDTGTAIGYKLTKPANITVSIHDLMGNLLWKNSYAADSNGGRATYNEVSWDCKTQSGQEVGNGIYVYLIIGEGKLLNKGKITVIK